MGGSAESTGQQLSRQIDKAELRDVVAEAEKALPPSLDSMFDDVYADLPWHLVEQRAELRKGPRAKGHH